MNKKKLLIPIIFVLILLIALSSGCTELRRSPVITFHTYANEYLNNGAWGRWSPYCKAKDQRCVYDTESHENWEDYEFSSGATVHKILRYFISDFDCKRHTTYYCRAVAYCYDFWGPLEGYPVGTYQGEEESFHTW